ncbi:tRNA(Ile)-lysidine synthase TilS/MesJ [Methanococcus voltae PS]|uniref:tRNA(Ile)-lysidine synthase TilS/MesJ n=1 Tax=Methanococcus voltae PS TaxID=523842 RepID=A0ABT2EZ03_METVO|nr:phosphoadenosine phosphosulfate reductase family protein [Methanococcus voltae]MCS3922288.1 tRNA(Ile)-lysidine synthase TilS/MesJ [Methanococcus voltae PS]
MENTAKPLKYENNTKNLKFTQWTIEKRNLHDLNELKSNIIKNLENSDLLDKKALLMLSGGKDSATALALCKELNINVELCIHYVHNWSWDISKNEAEKLAKKYEVPIIFPDITEKLSKKIRGAKGKSICRICKDIMKIRAVEYAHENGFDIIITGDTALEKISGPILDDLREKNPNSEDKEFYHKMELSKIPRRYDTYFLRPLLRLSQNDVMAIHEHYNINVQRVHEVGDKIGHWREGCCLKYCDPEEKISTDLFNEVFELNKYLTEVARENNIRASVLLPSKDILVLPKTKGNVKIVLDAINGFYVSRRISTNETCVCSKNGDENENKSKSKDENKNETLTLDNFSYSRWQGW